MWHKHNDLGGAADGRRYFAARSAVAHRIAACSVISAALSGVLVTPALAIDPHQPAHVRVVVTDSENRPLAGARVRLSLPVREPPGWPEPPEEPSPASFVEIVTDALGVAEFERVRPDDARQIRWHEFVKIELDGFRTEPSPEARRLDQPLLMTLFPGAQLEQTIVMVPVRATRIRVRDRQGVPLPGFRFAARAVGYSYLYEPLATDDRGECRWEHPVLEDGFEFLAGAQRIGGKLIDEPVVDLTAELLSAQPQMRRLTGTLLLADGSAAAGWTVAQTVRAGGRMGGDWRGPYYHELYLENLTRAGPEGGFECETVVDAEAEGVLGVVSPDRIPFFYSLSPHNWPDGDRHVTLRLPGVRRVHRGVVVDAEGRPVARLPIEVDNLDWNGRRWRVRTGEEPGWSQWPRDSAWRDVNGAAIEPIRTNAAGEYSIPVYYGSAARFRASRRGWTWKDPFTDLAVDALNVWVRAGWEQPMELALFRQYKAVTLVFEDEQGRRLSEIGVRVSETSAGGKVLWRGIDSSNVRDARGLHLFLKREIDRVVLTTSDRERQWAPHTTSIDLAEGEDQTVHITLDESLRWLPLTGQVLDPGGRGVPQVSVSLRRPPSDEDDARESDALRMSTVTDEAGRFAFNAAPDDCRIEVSSHSAQNPLPGVVLAPVRVDRQTRDVTIRLERERGGTVEVLLPDGIGKEAEALYLRHAKGADQRSLKPGRYRSLAFHAERGALDSGVVPPGEYILAHSDWRTPFLEPFAALGERRVEVKVGATTVVDLRDVETLKPLQRARFWNTVLVTQGDQPVSGAEVTVFAAVADPDDLARWVRQWRDGDRLVKQAAITNLKSAGALAVDAARAWEDEDLDQLFEDLGGPFHDAADDILSDGFDRACQDLTDDTGTVRCELEAGRHCVALARVRGRLIGWRPFVARGETVTVTLQSTRTLMVHSQHAEDEHGERWMSLRLERPMDIGARALMSALFGGDTWFGHIGWLPSEAIGARDYPMLSEGQTAWIMEDLPVGVACILTVYDPLREEGLRANTSAPITIEPGEGVQHVTW